MPNITTLKGLLEIVVKHGYLKPDRIREIEIQSSTTKAKVLIARGKHNKDIDVSAAEIIAFLDLDLPDGKKLNENVLANVIAIEARLPYKKLDPTEFQPEKITRLLSRPFALKNVVFPLREVEGQWEVALADPFNEELVQRLKDILRSPFKLVVTSKCDILRSITEVYGFRQSVEAAAKGLGQEQRAVGDRLLDLEQLVRLKPVQEIEATDQHIINAVEFLLNNAFEQRSSDIHIEPKREKTRIRFRIDGLLHEVNAIPSKIHGAFTSRLKMLARMDIAEKRRPQDGRIKTIWQGREVELRVSTLPVTFGEKIVIRIFDPDNYLQDLDDLGMPAQAASEFNSWASRPNGIILVTGPTGSGKTTTLYSILRSLATPEVNIVSIEDPVEMVFEEFSQISVQAKLEMGFAQSLRTILRQDPDIIMIGEIRDHDTAQAAVQAALTGHLVFSTLHTNDTPTAIPRLLDLGAESFLLASTLIGVLAQRLVRTICQECKQETVVTDDQAKALQLKAELSKRAVINYGMGCPACRGTGFVGRTGIFELLSINNEIRSLIKPGVTAYDIQQAALRTGFTTLKEQGVSKLLSGVTTFEETVRVLGL